MSDEGEGKSLPSGLRRSAPMIEVEPFRVPTDRYYEPDHHLWLEVSGPNARVGLDALGQEVSGTIAFVSLVPVGTRVKRGEPFGSIESQKYVGQLVAPVHGELTAINGHVLRDARLVNTDPFGEGWLVELKGIEPSQLARLVQGEEAIRDYFATAVQSYRRKGVLAEPRGSAAAESRA